MANYDGVFRTSYFKVTDEARYNELARGLSPSVYQFEKDLDGQIFHGFGDYAPFYYNLPASECQEVLDAIAEGKQFFDCNGERISDSKIDDEDVLYNADGTIFWDRGETDDYGEGFDWFVKELQKILPDDSCFIYIETGHENLRYIDAFVWMVTNKESRVSSLDEFIANNLNSMVGENVNVSWQY